VNITRTVLEAKEKEAAPKPWPSVELVISRFQEDLRWLRRVPETIRISVYNKGGEFALPEMFRERPGFTALSLPNEGREAHTYLTHLTRRYGSLADSTVFCQGHPFDHAPDLHGRLRLLAEGRERPDPFLWYGFLQETDDPFGRKLFVPWSKNPDRRELGTGRIFEELFGSPSPDFFHFCGGAQFSVSREAVHLRPPEFYSNALRLSRTFPDAAHAMERMWDRFFGSPAIAPSDLGPDGVRYLKRIRRLERRNAIALTPGSCLESI